MNQPSTRPNNGQNSLAEYERHFSVAAGALAAAIRTGVTDGGEIVSHLLATVAANLGGIHRLATGRPGSWEASHVEQFLASTVCEGGDHLLQYRTEPIEVVECVELAMVDLDIGCLYDESFALIDAIETKAANSGDEAAYDRLDVAGQLIDDLHAADYAAYCVAFEQCVRESADELTKSRGLSTDVPVSVRWVDWQGREQTIGSEAAWGTAAYELWEIARSKTAPPAFTEPLDSISGVPGEQLRTSGRMPHQRIPDLAIYAGNVEELGVSWGRTPL